MGPGTSALIAAASLAVAVQATTRVDAAISGVVTDGVTSRPVAGAVVSLSPPGSFTTMAEQFTDQQGRFVFTGLAAGDGYRVRVTKTGYFDATFGQIDPRTERFSGVRLSADEWFQQADVTLWRPGGMSGTVIDERGEPVVGVYVRLLRYTKVGGRTYLAAGPVTTTDDRGWYRLGGLPPGRYVAMVPAVSSTVPADAAATAVTGLSTQSIASSMASGRSLPIGAVVDFDATSRYIASRFPIPPPRTDGVRYAYRTTFSGDATTLAQAAAFELDPGAERTGVDVRLSPVPAFTVSGRVVAPPDALANLAVRLVPDGFEDLGPGSEAGTTLVSADGAFRFVNVPRVRT